MLWGDEKRLCLLYALTPIHAGSGQALKAVDLPIQRERHTAWPMVQASGIKGALRDWCEKAWKQNGMDEDLIDRIFGPWEVREGKVWAGAITVTDARLLLFPVRSNVAPFVHVTCPAVLKRFQEDLALVGGLKLSLKESPPERDEFLPLYGNFPENKELILEDMIAKQKNSGNNSNKKNFSDWLPENVPGVKFAALVSDEVFGFLVRTATEVQAHIAIDDATGTIDEKKGGLRYQEYLPADSVLYFLAFFADERNKREEFKAAFEVANLVMQAVSTHLQIGGDFTLGKGICKVNWIEPNASAGGEK